MEWTRSLEERATELVDRVLAGDPTAWRDLLVAISPVLERWAASHRLLRRCGLTGEDEPRAILVHVLSRLADRSYDNLRRFRAKLPPTRDALDSLDNLSRLDDDDDAGPLGRFGGWLRTLVDFAVKDHVRQRLGWRSTARTTFRIAPPGKLLVAVEAALRGIDGVASATYDADGGALVVEHAPNARDKVAAAITAAGCTLLGIDAARDRRGVGSGADRLDDSPEPKVSAGMTDRLTLEKMLAEIRQHADAFPADMRTALELWMTDHEYDEIADRIGLADAQKARALVRAALARLRDRFRGAFPEWFG